MSLAPSVSQVASGGALTYTLTIGNVPVHHRMCERSSVVACGSVRLRSPGSRLARQKLAAHANTGAAWGRREQRGRAQARGWLAAPRR
jgi:hypothetical protein